MRHLLLTAKLCFGAMMGMMLGVSAPAQAADLILAPSNDWTLREYSSSCRLVREFGAGENVTALWIEQAGTEPYYNVTLIGHPLRNPYGRAVSIQFGPDEKPSLRSYITAKSSKGRPTLRMYGVTLAPGDVTVEGDGELLPIDAARKEAITSLRLSQSIVKPVLFELGPMGKHFAKLQDCAGILAAELTLAGLATERLARPPEPIDPGNWVRPADYPAYLVRARVEAMIDFRLTVNAKGRASACHITGSNRPQLFDDAVCLSLMKRARFEPALDGEGEPTASYYSSRVRFTVG